MHLLKDAFNMNVKEKPMLANETLEIIKSTVPLLEKHGKSITETFYTRLFSSHPDLKNIFNMANQGKGEQSRALADAVIAYAKHIENVEILAPTVQRIANKHASLGVQPEHYPVVGETLLFAIQKVLELPDGHAALVAWGEAYGALAKIFTDAESNIYEANAAQTGGWEGYRDFYIDHIETENASVKSFYLKPSDGGALPDFKGGQYVGVRLRPKGSDHVQIRQYSLSQFNASPEYFRISVKTEDKGLVSQHLHQCAIGEKVSLQAPTGVFTLQTQKSKHIFIAAGVGITPLICMLQEAIYDGILGRDLLFIECVRDVQQLIFAQELVDMHPQFNFHHKLCFTHMSEGDHQGQLNTAVLTRWGEELDFNTENAQVYFCGPKTFMSSLNQCYLQMGYSPENIHYEVFGPTTSL